MSRPKALAAIAIVVFGIVTIVSIYLANREIPEQPVDQQLVDEITCALKGLKYHCKWRSR